MLVAAVAAGAILAQDLRVAPLNPALVGVGVQRTMRKLAASTPTKRNKVVIVFYGQSITDGQPWVDDVVADLKARFPHAEIDARNLAIAGFATQILKYPAEQDIYPLNADLVLLHVYGSHIDYEEILQKVRLKTTSEIVIQTDHATSWPRPEPETGDRGLWWDWRMNNETLPELAKRYAAGLAPVRDAWVQTLKDNKLEPKDLLSDAVHLNARGNKLLGKLIPQYLVVRNDLPATPDPVRIPIKWKHNRASVSTYGTRVEVEVEGATKPFFLQARVDGRTPSQHDEAYANTRSTPRAWRGPVMLTRVDHLASLLAEDWKLIVTSSSEEGKKWKFRVEGSKTGPDGEGSSDAKFVSKSRRVVIEPDAWYRTGPVEVGFESRWTSYLNGRDSVSSNGTHLLIHGLRPGTHEVELIQTGSRPPRVTLIVHQPPGWPKL